MNEKAKNLDSVDCKAASECPAQPYIPSVLWQCKFDSVVFFTNLGLKAGAISIGKNSDKAGKLGKFVFIDNNKFYWFLSFIQIPIKAQCFFFYSSWNYLLFQNLCKILTTLTKILGKY